MGNTLIVELVHRAQATAKAVKSSKSKAPHPLSDLEICWYNYPPATKSFAIIVDDPSQTQDPVHYMSYDIPVGNEVISHLEWLGNAVTFSGQSPLRIRVYALKGFTNLAPNATLEQLRRAMEGKVVAVGQQWLGRQLH